jgi:DNA-3-methyladenine glycosylase I
MDDEDVERLMGDSRIIRNRAKIDATISNARIALKLVRQHPGALDELLWGFAPASRPVVPRELSEVPSATDESRAMSGALRALGFRFVGPTTLYALMQSSGMVDDHVRGCWLAGVR